MKAKWPHGVTVGRVARMALCWLVTATLHLDVFGHDTTVLYVEDVSPFYFTEDGTIKGVLYDVLNEMTRRAGKEVKIVALPLRRKSMLFEVHRNALASIWRISDVGQSDSRMLKLLDERIVFVTRSDSTIDLSSIEVMRDTRVGVLLGGPAEEIAIQLGFHHIEAINSAENNAQKLAMGRIDIWMAGQSVVESAQRKLGHDMKSLRVSSLSFSASAYLSCRYNCANKDIQKWGDVLSTMHNDGTFNRTLRRYGYQLPPTRK